MLPKGGWKMMLHSKNMFEKIIRINRQRKEFTYLHVCWIVIPQQLARWMCWMWLNPNIGAIFQSRLHGSIFQISRTSKSEAFNMTQKKNNKNTTERIYIPSLLLDCDVEAVAVFLLELRGSCSSSSSSLSSTRQIKKIRFIEYQREQCCDNHGFTMNSKLCLVLQSSSLEVSYKQHAHHSCLYP